MYLCAFFVYIQACLENNARSKRKTRFHPMIYSKHLLNAVFCLCVFVCAKKNFFQYRIRNNTLLFYFKIFQQLQNNKEIFCSDHNSQKKQCSAFIARETVRNELEKNRKQKPLSKFISARYMEAFVCPKFRYIICLL